MTNLALSLRIVLTCAFFLLKQAISQCNTRGSPVFVAFLDASKAFEKVNHYTLFKKLNSMFLRFL